MSQAIYFQPTMRSRELHLINKLVETVKGLNGAKRAEFVARAEAIVAKYRAAGLINRKDAAEVLAVIAEFKS